MNERLLSGGQLIAIIRLRRVYPRHLMAVWNHQFERRPSLCRERSVEHG